ncbi:TPA: integrase, partial [Candidatus Poribacteria bacterium]|nr:integrase [Candidatus Poribacteria bacterium]
MIASIQFKPQSRLRAEANLANLIVLAREKVKLWSNLEGFNWDSSIWPTHDRKIRFLKLKERGLHHKKNIAPHQIMTSPFIDFAKTYVRYNQQKRQTKTFGLIIRALQLLETSLIELEGQADIIKVSNRHLDKAVELMLKEGFKNRQYISVALTRIAQDLGQWHIAVSNIKYWKHPFVRSESYLTVSKRDPELLRKKLPEDDALLALAEVFANGYTDVQDDEDVFITCITALLLSAPMRISEILYFRTDPLRIEKDSLGNEQLYISYYVPKNGKYVLKEIPKIMADHAREAVRRLREMTEEGRNLAKHFESAPDHFYRHKECPDVPDNQELTFDQVVNALGLETRKATENWIARRTGSYRLTGWNLNSLWQLILGEHRKRNPHFPFQVNPSSSTAGKPLRMSESLMCFRFWQVANKTTTSPVLLAPINRSFFYNRVTPQIIKRGNFESNTSFFLKHGYDSGLTLQSHQLRHFLNTLAQEAGVGIDAITDWSTRASKEQSRIYMHQAPERKGKMIADRLNLITRETMNPITKDEYQVMNFGPIITTRYGICAH